MIEDIKQEIIMSEKLIEEKVIPQMEEAIRRYTSKFNPVASVGPDGSNLWEVNLNEIYPIIQFELPSIFFRNPKVFMKPRNKNFIVKRTDPITGKKVDITLDSAKSAKTQEHLLNYIIEQINYKKEGRRVLLDALLFKYGVLWHGYKGEFGMTEEQSIFIENEQLFVKRISPRNFIFDPKVTLSNIEEAEWIGRWHYVLLRDLQEDKRLKLDKNLRGKPGFGTLIDSLKPFKRGNDTRSTTRPAKTLLELTSNEFQERAKFVKVYEIFKRPTPKEKRQGEKGKILLLTDEQDKPLRENDWPYKAKGWPAKVLMFNEVPEENFGLSDLEVYGPIADQKNLILNIQARNAESNSKSIIGYNKEEVDEEDVQKFIDGEQSMVGTNGDPRDKIVVHNLGGASSNELYMLDQRIQFNLDEKSGISELKKGFLRSGEESATSVQIRNAGASARPAYRQDLMTDFLKESFSYLNNLNQQFMPVKDAVRIMGTLDIEWSENPSKEEIQADTDIEIDAISMLPENPDKEIQELNTVIALMTEALSNPQIYQKLQQEGKTFNLSPLIEQLLMRLKMRDPEIFRSIRPEESQGFASVAELRAAEANVQAALTGQQLPSPPQEGQDHQARMGVYESVRQLFAIQGQIVQQIEQLLMAQAALAEAETEKQAPRPGQGINITKPRTPKVG